MAEVSLSRPPIKPRPAPSGAEVVRPQAHAAFLKSREAEKIQPATGVEKPRPSPAVVSIAEVAEAAIATSTADNSFLRREALLVISDMSAPLAAQREMSQIGRQLNSDIIDKSQARAAIERFNKEKPVIAERARKVQTRIEELKKEDQPPEARALGFDLDIHARQMAVGTLDGQIGELQTLKASGSLVEPQIAGVDDDLASLQAMREAESQRLSEAVIQRSEIVNNRGEVIVDPIAQAVKDLIPEGASAEVLDAVAANPLDYLQSQIEDAAWDPNKLKHLVGVFKSKGWIDDSSEAEFRSGLEMSPEEKSSKHEFRKKAIKTGIGLSLSFMLMMWIAKGQMGGGGQH